MCCIKFNTQGVFTRVTFKPFFLVLFATILMISGCSNGPGFMGSTFSKGTTVFPNKNKQDEVRENSKSSNGLSSNKEENNKAQRAQYFGGDNDLIGTSNIELPKIERVAEGLKLNFINTDINVVAEAVLGDMLKLPFRIDPDVTGSLSLQTSYPVDDDSVLLALEVALQTKNIALYKDGTTYVLLPTAKVPSKYGLVSRNRFSANFAPGYSVNVVKVKYSTPTEMKKVLEPFAPKGGILVADDTRQLMIIAGSSREIAVMLNTIETFDVDWLKGMSFALYKVDYVEAKTLADELLEVFGDANSPLAGMVRLIPIDRLNSILGISVQPKYLRDVETWIEKLDIGGSNPGRRIYVYQINHGRAVDIANTLSSVMGVNYQGNNGGYNNYNNQNFNNSYQDNNYNNGNSNQSGQNRNRLNRNSNSNTPSQNFSQGNNRQNSSSQRNDNRNRNFQQGDYGNNYQQNYGQQNIFESGGLMVVPNEDNNSILILASPSEFSVIKAAIKQIDIPPRQVLIEATLVEVTLNDELRFGVQWFLERDQKSATLSSTGAKGIASQFPGFSFIYDRSANAGAVLNALASVTDIKVLSSPKLMVLNNHTATIQVGDQVPVAKQSSQSVTDSDAPLVNTVEFKDTGVILTVTPRISEGGAVLLEVDQEVSNVSPTTSSGIDSPTIQQRRITTTVVVQDGETIALGGLIRESESIGGSGIPILKDIPLLGHLFSTNNRSSRRTELIILITPRIAHDEKGTREVLDYLRTQFRSLEKTISGKTTDETIAKK